MIVCITEKPSVAKDIASILGANIRRDGYFEGNNYLVTWTFGHLCTLKEPQDYTERWKSWSLGALPMIPPKFGIKLIADKGIEHQFGVIESLIKNADKVINCGDAGQEGELIQRWVMQKAQCDKPVQRLWISSLTDESIKEGFKSLRPQVDFDKLYFAGLSRAIGDWILGMNATRLFTLKYSNGKGVLSIGRVQTPTLALVVERQKQIENFVPEDFWEIKTLYRDVTFLSTKGRFDSEESAEVEISKIKEEPLVITSITTKRSKESAPKLFDLTSLQVECNKKYGFSADVTLKLIQSLYEKKLTTYPRVDTTYLSEDIYPKIGGILQAMKPYAKFTQPLLEKKLPKSKKVFDNSKVTDHHAIIPTNVTPGNNLQLDEKRVYDLVARRFMGVFYPDCEFDKTIVTAQVGEMGFKANGKQIVKEGWRGLYNTGDNQLNNDDKLMPEFEEGESGSHEPSILKKTTQPPAFYTEGTLLRAMETAGKLVDDDELREAMKDNGIGRPSTRAAIIETLFKRKYIVREGKSLKATAAGIALIDTIKVDLLKSAKLTGIWENKLRQIEKGSYDAVAFVTELKNLIGKIVVEVLSDNSGCKIQIQQEEEKKKAKPKVKASKPRKPAIKSVEEIECPICGKGHLIKGNSAYGCSEYKNGCTFRLQFSYLKENATLAQIAKAVKSMKK